MPIAHAQKSPLVLSESRHSSGFHVISQTHYYHSNSFYRMRGTAGHSSTHQLRRRPNTNDWLGTRSRVRTAVSLPVVWLKRAGAWQSPRQSLGENRWGSGLCDGYGLLNYLTHASSRVQSTPVPDGELAGSRRITRCS